MQNLLVVVDMQNDFIDGSLGTKEAVLIVPAVVEKIKEFSGLVLFTRDTHYDNYLETQEGKNLPVKHCIVGSEGHKIRKEIEELRKTPVFDKPGFGSLELSKKLEELDKEEKIEKITFIGLCTDICVITNAMIAKATLPEAIIEVDAKCCAGVSPASHKTALEAMKVCQIKIINEQEKLYGIFNRKRQAVSYWLR